MFVLLPMLISASAASADIRPILRHQGFYRPLNGRETIKYAGHIQQGRNDYQIYTYFGVFRAAVVDHGVSTIIVMLNGSTYVGEWNVGMPMRCRVRGKKVLCHFEDSPHGRPVVVEFTKRGPPYEIWLGGEVESFEFGNKLKAYRCNDRPCQRLEKWAHLPWWKMTRSSWFEKTK